MNSPGQATDLWTNADGGAVRLSNFDIGRHELKAEHQAGLSRDVLPVLRKGGSALVMGLTSRSGSDVVNAKLSQRRAAAVIKYLQHVLDGKPLIAQEACTGEQAAALAGEPDGKEHPNWRAAIVIYSRRPELPKRERRPPRLPNWVSVHLVKTVKFATGGGDVTALVITKLVAVSDPERAVAARETIGVPDTYQVTRIDVSSHVSGPIQVHTLRFRWGPPKTQVEIWKDGSLETTVRTARAMQIYEQPGHYILMPNVD